MEMLHEFFEDTIIYDEILSKVENGQCNKELSRSCLLINGVVNFDSFQNQIRSLADLQSIIQINSHLFLVLLNSDITFFNQVIKKQLEIMHYEIFSILLKKSLAKSIINEFNKVNQNDFYIFSDDNVLSSEKNDKKSQENKINSAKFLYKFKKFTDLIDCYVKLVKEKDYWPLFAILPIKFYFDVNFPNERKPNMNIIKGNCTSFSPLKSLFYFSFIDKKHLKSKRIINANNFYSLNHIDDIQINHFYDQNPKKPYYMTYRTFIGFLNKFRCIYAFDRFVHISKSKKYFTDIQLLDDLQFPKPCIKYNFFYIETNSLLHDCSLLLSMYYKDYFDLDGLTYINFNNFTDFSKAIQILKTSLDENSYLIIKNLKLIEKNDFTKIFKEEDINDLVFFIFQMENFSEKKKYLLPLLHESIMIKELICSMNNESYIVVGFENNEIRKESFLFIKNNQKVVILNEYTPIKRNFDYHQDNFIIDLNNYIKKDLIGSGGFGKVIIAENKINHKNYAAKIKKKADNNSDFLQEIEFYKKFKYPLIISFHGYSLKDFNGDSSPVILLEYMPNGSLNQKLSKSLKSFKDILKHKKYIIILGIAKAMEFLHSKGVFHRDLKPENILLDENFYPRLCDFGLSLIVNNQKKKKEEIGTIKYMAPEIIKEKDCNTSAVDVYSFSLIAYELLTGKDFFNLPKYAKVPKKLKFDVIKGIRPDISDIYDEEILVFFQRCWSSEPSERPTFSEICDTLLKKKFQLAFEADELEILKYKYWFNDNLENSYHNLLSMQQAESKGNIELMVEYANRLYLGIDVPINKEESFRLFKKGVNHKNINAMYYLGHYSKEYQYLKNAADLGHEKAMIEYGKIIQDKDDKKAVIYFKKAAELGNDEGMFLTGTMLLSGKGIKMNKKEASKYFQLAADLGNVQSMFEYARMIHQGDGVDTNFEKASEYYKMAAYYGNVNSMTNLGLMLKDGKLPVDLKESAFYLKKAANLGNYDAMYHYGNLLCVMALIGECEYETETEDNYEKAAKYFKIAADAGNIEASVRYGTLFTKKLIETDDYIEPIHYLRNAAYKENTNGIIEYLSALSKFAINLPEHDRILSGIERIVFQNKLIEKGYPSMKFFLETTTNFINPLNSFIKGDHCFEDDDEEEEEEEENDRDYNESNFANQKKFIKKHKFSKNQMSDILSLFQYSNKYDNKSINKVEINGYESFQINPNQYYIYLSQYSIPLKIQKKIDDEFKKIQSLEKKQMNICHPKNPNDLYTFYFFPSYFHNSLQGKLFNILKPNFQCYFPQSCESMPFENYLYFNESLIPENYYSIFFKKLETIQDIIDIKHNIFDGNQIATYLIVKKGTEKNIIQSIRNFLLQQKILFKSFVYPLQNNIIINEKIMLKNLNDFNVILKEIRSIGLKPIYTKRNMLFLYEFYPLRKLFERFSFICFQNEFEKMKAINHLNSIIFANKKKEYVEYNIDHFHSSINEHIFSERVQKIIPEIFEHLKGYKNIQRNVFSIESPVERTYIGFDTLRHLKKGHIQFSKKIKIIQACNEPKLFWKKKGNKYLLIRHDLNSNAEHMFHFISSFASDVQVFCHELNENNEIIYTSYFGYSTENDIKKAKLLLNKNKISFDEYNEVTRSCLLLDEPREAYLFYDSF